MDDNRRPLSIRRIVGAAIALALGGFAIYCGIQSHRYGRRFDEWMVAEPVSVAADLSKPGITSAPFIQSCQASHGESVLLRIEDAGPDPDALLAGLQGRLDVLDAKGEAVVSAELADRLKFGVQSTPDEGATLAYFHPFEVGRYTLRLEVKEPAPGLSAHQQRLYARYRLCGLEQMPAAIAAIAAVVAGLPALIVGGCTLDSLLRHGWRRPARPAQTEPAAAPTGRPRPGPFPDVRLPATGALGRMLPYRRRFTTRPFWRDWLVGVVLAGSGWAVFSPQDRTARMLSLVLGCAGAAVLLAALVHVVGVLARRRR